MTRAAVGLTLLALPALPGCITQALWHKERVDPELHTVSVPCEVIEVTTAADASDPSIHVRFAPESVPGAPAHLRGLHPDRPGSFRLDPFTTADDWRRMPGADLFAPVSFDLRIASGTYFRRSPANATLQFHGAVQTAALGAVVPAERIPAAVREAGPLPADGAAPTLESRALASFRARDWAELLPDLPSTFVESVPLAWVDGDLNRVAVETPESWHDMEPGERARMEEIRLLARVEDASGNRHYALIGLSTLLQSADLEMRREADLVHWTRTQTWTAQLLLRAPETGSRLPYPVPLRGQGFDYRWSREIERSEVALDVLRTLATPVTAALDFVIMTNEPLSRLARYLAGDRTVVQPSRPKIGR